MSDVQPPNLCLHPETQCPAVQSLAVLREQIALLQDQLTSLQQQVITDPLTQLHNKRHFNSSLETEMERTRRSQQPTSLILADLDHFKAINDTHGHATGDRVLVAAASLLKSELRMIDIPCRYGGEEFAIILPSTPLLTAIQVAERLRGALAHTEIDAGAARLSVTGSFGVATFYPQQQRATPLSLLERADERLYRAKSAGRNRVCAEIQSSDTTALSVDERAALTGGQDPELE
jgi:two-component system, cell cycle response regulator